ncbi:MFS transporter [Kosakonia sp. H02]|nr:MFS transporter [Kosakonia sp. H02]
MQEAVQPCQAPSFTGRIALLAALTFLIQASDTSLLYLSLPTIAQALHLPLRALDGLALSYLVAVVLTTPISPWLMTRYGEQRVYQLALGLFMLAVLGCARADSLPALCLWRLVQGSGGALMLASARVLLLKTVPDDEQTRQLNRVTAIGLLGTLLGPVCGGIGLTLMPWRGLFLLPLPLCMLCLLASRRCAVSVITDTPRFDIAGYLVVAPALLLCLAVVTPVGQILLSPIGLLPACITLGVLATLSVWRRLKHPMDGLFDSAVLAHPAYRISLLGNALVRICFSSTPLLLSLRVQTSATPATASMVLLAFAGGALSVRFFLSQALERLGYRRLLITGCVLCAVLLVAMSAPDVPQTSWWVLSLAFGLGLTSSAIYCSLNTLAFSTMSDNSYGAGNSLLTLVQLISMMLGITISFAFLAHRAVAWPEPVTESYGALFRLMGYGLLLSAALFSRLSKAQGIRRAATG